jgi:hypothetical protein
MFAPTSSDQAGKFQQPPQRSDSTQKNARHCRAFSFHYLPDPP